MNVVQINGGIFGSTGKIMFSIKEVAEKQNITVYCASPITTTNRKDCSGKQYYKIGNYWGRKISVLLGRITGFSGCFSIFATMKFLREVNNLKPDLIHLHNLHESYINIPMLFSYIKKNKLPVVWTLHDCTCFTGQCSHFVLADCNKWKSGCGKCPQYKKAYPKSYFDRTSIMWKLKKKMFLGLDKAVIVTPSEWLANLVKESFLGEYTICVINNGIDLNVFKPTKSDFRKKYNLLDKNVILGVSFGWSYEKGLYDFIELSKNLPQDYKIVLVGTNEEIDTKLNEHIISIHMTQNQEELAEIYSTSDVFVNPTHQETFPTVNIEALACGTPVVTFNTGGSPEIIDNKCGIVTEDNSTSSLLTGVINVCKNKSINAENCVKRVRKFYNQKDKYVEYVALYKKMLNN